MTNFAPDQRVRTSRCAWTGRARPLLIALLPLLLLQGGCASIVIHEQPTLDRTALVIPASSARPPADTLALIQAGVTLDRKHPEWAVAYYRDAALAALPYVLHEKLSTRTEIEAASPAQGVYRRAIEYMLETAHRQAQAEGSSWTDVLARTGIGVRGRVGIYEAARWEEALPTRRFDVKGFRHRAGRGGAGAPVVVCLTRSGRWGEPATETSGALVEPCEAHFPRTLYRAAAATLRTGVGPDEPQAVLDLHDPVRHPAMQWQPDARARPFHWPMT